MYLQENCPCCGDPNPVSYGAIVAPFVRDFVRPDPDKRITRLRQCQSCGHRYFADRYDDREMASLYSGYRGAEYLSVRRKCEPWYTAKVNSANLDEGVIALRKEAMTNFLRPFLKDRSGSMTIAVVGGDAGQFIPQEFASHAFVVETSAQAPRDGVTRVERLEDIPFDIDLIICSNVIEHIPDPLKFVSGMSSSRNLSGDCLFYIEVPLERYSISPLLRSGLYRRYLQAVAAIRPITICVDFLSVLARSYANAVFPPLMLKLHEHVNFYTTESLSRLAESSGLEILSICEDKKSTVRTIQGVIRLLARIRPASG